MGGDAKGGGQCDLGPCGVVMGGSLTRAGIDRAEHLCRLGPPGAAKGIEVLQRQEGTHGIRPPRRHMVGHIAPTVAHIDTREFHPRQQRHGADLVLGIVLFQPPDMLVIGGAHIVVTALRQVEQRQMPPIVAPHEGVQVAPRLGHAFHETRAFSDAALR